jgi:hypothetical protein
MPPAQNGIGDGGGGHLVALFGMTADLAELEATKLNQRDAR